MIRIVLTTTGPQLSPAAWDAALTPLNNAEQIRLRRFRRWQDAQASLKGRQLSASLTAAALSLDSPIAIEFARDASGKPYVSSPTNTGIDVNVSHSAGYIAAAISTLGRIGIDVEIERPIHQGLIDRVCAPGEIDQVEVLSLSACWSYFFQLWTLKEAYCKAIGVGLACDPRSITFQAEHDWFNVYDPCVDVSRWRARSWQPYPGIWLAVCAEHALPPNHYEEFSQ